MGLVGASFGVAVAAVVAVSLFAGRRHPSFGLACMMAMFWWAANISGPWLDPVIDTGGFYAAMNAAFARRRMKWAWTLCLCFACQLIIHPFFIGDTDSHLRQLLLNLLFAAGLMAIAFPGCRRAVCLVLDHLSGHRYPRRPSDLAASARRR